MDDLAEFIKYSKTDRNLDAVSAGVVSTKAKNKVSELTGVDVTWLRMDGGHIRHAHKKANHNLEPDDLLLFEKVVNEYDFAELDTERKNRGSKVLRFSADSDGEIIFVVGVHRKEGGFLELLNAYRKKKVRRGSTGK
jgi:hypothetical protein